MDRPEISVIIPAYNSADYTVETVESVLAQTYGDLEVIVVDDGSTDNTRQALGPYYDRIEYVFKKNGGACSARNLGIRRARGEFIACLDCDDLWLPDKLEHSLPVLEAESKMGFVFTPCYTINATGEVTGEVRYTFDLDQAYLNLLMENFVPAPTVIMRSSCLEQVGLFDESIFIPADWDMWLRLAHRFVVGYVDRPLSKYRLASNYTLRNVEQLVQESKYVLEKQFRIAQELSAQNRSRSMSALLFVHSQLYRRNADMKRARENLLRAIKYNPLNWRLYFCFILSFLKNTAILKCL